MKTDSKNRLPLYIIETATALVNFNETEKEVPSHEGGESETMYEYDSVRVSLEDFNYGALVSAIINDRYNNDQMQAIVNNHLLEANDEEHEAEYNAMQAWRVTAKQVARQVFPA